MACSWEFENPLHPPAGLRSLKPACSEATAFLKKGLVRLDDLHPSLLQRGHGFLCFGSPQIPLEWHRCIHHLLKPLTLLRSQSIPGFEYSIRTTSGTMVCSSSESKIYTPRSGGKKEGLADCFPHHPPLPDPRLNKALRKTTGWQLLPWNQSSPWKCDCSARVSSDLSDRLGTHCFLLGVKTPAASIT